MNLKKILTYLNQRNKLSLRNIRSGHEVWHIFISRLNLILAGLSAFVVVFAMALVVIAYTPILDLIPGYPGNKSRMVLMENIMRLDSLEQQVRRWEHYQDNLSQILAGNLAPQAADSASATVLSSQRTDTMKMSAAAVKGKPARKIKSDSLLRMQMSSDSVYVLRKQARARSEKSFDMMPPVRGTLKEAFSPRQGRNGVEILTLANQVVMSVMDGTIISQQWNPETSYTIIVQHGGNMTSSYTNVKELLHKTGQRVRAGEAIGLTRGVVGTTAPTILFELWYNGNAVDPENYITF